MCLTFDNTAGVKRVINEFNAKYQDGVRQSRTTGNLVTA